MKTCKKQVLGFHKKNKRIWITNGTIVNASLAAGDTVRYQYDLSNGQLIIEKATDGTHKIAETTKGGIIDIVNSKVTQLFQDNEYVDIISDNERIIVKGHFSENKIKERESSLLRRLSCGEPLRKGGAFSGLGLLCRSIHRGIKKAGVGVKQRFANEYNPIPAEVNLSGNEIWDDAFNDAVFSVDDIYTMDMSVIPKLDILVMGSPCPAFSNVNTNLKKDGKTDIFHPDSGTIFQPILEMIRHANPAVVVLENSKFFENSVFDYIMSDIMKRFGYESTSTVITGQAFGDFEKRERLCRIWHSKGLPAINLEDLPFQREPNRTLSEILEPIALDDKRWARRPYLEAKDNQKENCHQYSIVSLDTKKLPTLGANYHKIQPDSPMIPHPSLPMVTRILTPAEHCNLRDIGGRLKENIVAVVNGSHHSQRLNRSNAKAAHQMLGNSCSPKAWESVGYRIGEWLRQARESENSLEYQVAMGF